jgi:hypothetical protein
MTSIDPVILGHNQFIGVSHLSQDVARTRAEKFSDVAKIGEVIKFCAESGVNGMMLSTHERARDILDYLKAEGLAGQMNLYPLIPYAQGYVRRMNAVGLSGMLREIFLSAPASKKASISYHGAVGYLRKDFTRMLGAFIDLELLPFKDFNVKAVFLHDAFVDLSIALGAEEQINFFAKHVERNYGTVPAFTTMNFSRLMDRFRGWGIVNPLVMTTFNKIGFQMNPSKEECERCLRENDVDVVAMSTLAAGYLAPREAYEYVFSLPNIRSIVVGVSSVEHARETFDIVKSMGCPESRAPTRGTKLRARARRR